MSKQVYISADYSESFIEVLRNDFPTKQIILSTHETDKENYILYKFLKYNLKGQSFNVKDNMY